VSALSERTQRLLEEAKDKVGRGTCLSWEPLDLVAHEQEREQRAAYEPGQEEPK